MERRWIWPFELLDKLGEGGMGVVYRARYVKTDRIVAVKLLPPSITDETLLTRFEREMQLLKTLRHPHIVHTFGGKCEGDQRFYAMELTEGGTIDDLILDKGRLSVDSTVAYAVQMCSGLAYAHEKGIIHRDVKPGNFLLTKTGSVKLGDFGLAIMAAGSKLTAAGKTMGTFRYMAPEQIRGKPEPCPQTDLYALGVVLFEMLTGRVPFEADAPAEVLHQHLKTPPPRVSSLAPNVPMALDALIDRLLQKRIEDRPASAVEVGISLKSLDERVRISDRRTAETTSPAMETDTAVERFRIAGVPAVSGGWPFWMIAVPPILFLIAAAWGWSRGDEVAALARVEEASIKTINGSKGVPEKVEAIETLALIGAAGDASLETLIAALGDADPAVREAAAMALGRMGEDAKAASGTLLKLAREDEREEVRVAALAAHKAITGEESSLTGG